jgi:hypothetical protein
MLDDRAREGVVVDQPDVFEAEELGGDLLGAEPGAQESPAKFRPAALAHRQEPQCPVVHIAAPA